MEKGHRGVAIDTLSPFRSVKEAVALFGERVLAGELYAKHLQEMQSGGDMQTNGQPSYTTVAAELEETKQCLEQALEENATLATTLESLKLELEQTKTCLAKFHLQEDSKKTTEDEIKEVKFVENDRRSRATEPPQIDEQEDKAERMKSKEYASPHSLAEAMASTDLNKEQTKKSKKKKMPVHPLVGWLVGKKSSARMCPSS